MAWSATPKHEQFRNEGNRSRLRSLQRLAEVLVLVVVSALALPSFAYRETSKGDPEFSAFGPLEERLSQTWTDQSLSSYGTLTSGAFSLLAYIRDRMNQRSGELDPSVERYNRTRHFGRWIRLRPQETCLDTRGLVLIRDAAPNAKIEYAPDRCLIVRGKWNDPYSGRVFKLTSAIQVDHLVPLRDAYDSGAHAWRPARRCHYFNYMGNDFHLLAVSGHENMSKGDRAPDRYLPPRESFQCEYVNYWMKIKAIWNLQLTESEANAIENVIAERRCRKDHVTMSLRELEIQREASSLPVEACQRFERDLQVIDSHLARAN